MKADLKGNWGTIIATSRPGNIGKISGIKRMNTLYGLLCLLMVMADVGLIGQNIRILDAKSDEPVPFVTIFTPDTTRQQQSALTNNEGVANISAFRGYDTLSFRRVGYEPLTLTIGQIAGAKFLIRMKEEPFALTEVVIAANRWEQDRSRVPAKIATVGADQIAFQNPQTAADLIGSSNAVFIQKSQMGGGSPMIRGFAANRLLIVVDGVRMNNAVFRSGNLQNIISIDPNAVQQAEVVFGPGSVIYGSDALGGVMNFHTLRPRYSHTEQVQVRGGATARFSTANEEKTIHGHLNIGSQRFSSLTSFTFTDFSDQRMGRFGPDDYLSRFYSARIDGLDTMLPNPDPRTQTPTAYNQANLMQKFRFRASEDLDIEYIGHYSTTGNIPRYDRLVEMVDGLPRSAEWYYGPQQWAMQQVRAQHQRKTKLYDVAKASVAWQWFDESRHDRRFVQDLRNSRSEQVQAWSLNLDADKVVNKRMQLFYGIEGLYNSISANAFSENIVTGETALIATRYPDDSEWYALAAYTLIKYQLDPKLLLETGLRYSRTGLTGQFDNAVYAFPFDELRLNNGAFSGSVGLVYRPTEKWQINLVSGSGFRAPNMDDAAKVFDSEPGNVVVPNPGLKPEYAFNSEVGMLYRDGHRIQAEVNVFGTYLHNAMERRPFTFNGEDSIAYDGLHSRVEAVQNVDYAYIYGIQAALKVMIVRSLYLHVKYNWTHGIASDGEPVRHVAPTFGRAALAWDRNRWEVQAYTDFNGEISNERMAPSERNKPFLYARNDEGNLFAPAWYTLNLKAGYKAHQNVSVYAGLENITNQRYRPYSSGLAAPGRNLVFSVRARF